MERRLEREEYEAALDAKYRNPQFDAIEAAYGKPISAPLRSLYENYDEVRRSSVNRVIARTPSLESLYISGYFPLDRETAEAELHWDEAGSYFAFATDGGECTWAVDPTDDDAEVMVYDLEADRVIATGVRLDALLSLPEEKQA